MRKSILTLVLSFLFFGLSVANVEASNGSMQNNNKIQNKGSQSSSREESISRFNTNLSKIKKICSDGNCNFWIQQSATAFDNMISACDYAESSPECSSAQNWLGIIMQVTLDSCSQSKVIRKRDSLPSLDHKEDLRETKA